MIDTSSLDLIVGILALAVAAWFLLAWRRVGESALLLFAIGLALKGAGYALGTSDEFAPDRAASARELVRITVLSVGAIVMIAAYLTERSRNAWRWIGIGLALVIGIGIVLDVLAAPLGRIEISVASPVVHGLLTLANFGCAIFAFAGYRQAARAGRALVPAAFLVWGLSNYTWLMIDFGAPASFGLWVNAMRLLALVLLVAALVLPRGAAAEVPIAEA